MFLTERKAFLDDYQFQKQQEIAVVTCSPLPLGLEVKPYITATTFLTEREMQNGIFKILLIKPNHANWQTLFK